MFWNSRKLIMCLGFCMLLNQETAWPFHSCSLEGRNLSSIYAYGTPGKSYFSCSVSSTKQFCQTPIWISYSGMWMAVVGSPVTTLLLLLNTLWKFLITTLKKANSLVSLKRAACLWNFKKVVPGKLITFHANLGTSCFQWLLTSDTCWCNTAYVV